MLNRHSFIYITVILFFYKKNVFYVIYYRYLVIIDWIFENLSDYNEKSQNSYFARDALEHFQMHSLFIQNTDQYFHKRQDVVRRIPDIRSHGHSFPCDFWQDMSTNVRGGNLMWARMSEVVIWCEHECPGGHLMWARMSGPVKNRMGTNVRGNECPYTLLDKCL